MKISASNGRSVAGGVLAAPTAVPMIEDVIPFGFVAALFVDLV
jgi:hypothetical protein